MPRLEFSYRHPITVDHMKAWALRASKLTTGQCDEGQKLLEYMRMIERDNRRRAA